MIKLLKTLSKEFRRVSMSVTGLNIKRVTDIATENGIKIKNIKRSDFLTLEFEISYADACKIKTLLPDEEYGCRIFAERGIMRRAIALKNRYVLIVGTVISVIAIALLSNRTFTVRVHGCEDEDTEKIIAAAYEAGAINPYGKISTDEITAAVLSADEDIVWASVRVKGVVTDIFVKKRENIKQSEYCEKIVASKDGKLINLTVTGGTCEVENGQTVIKGQTLISGKEILGETEYPVSAEGKAIASVWYYASEEVLLEEEISEVTGRASERTEISVFGIKAAHKECTEYENYIAERTRVNTFFLPVEIYKVKYFETEKKTVFYEKGQLAEETALDLEKKILSQLPENAKIKEKNFGAEEKDGVLTVWMYIETVEDIAQRG